MKNIFNFKDFLNEWIQDEYFTKHPDFYISKNIEDSKKLKQANKEEKGRESLLSKQLRDVNINDITFISDDYDIYTYFKIKTNKIYFVKTPEFLNKCAFGISKIDEIQFVHPKLTSDYYYKIVLAFLNFYEKESYNFIHIDINLVNELLKIGEYYGIYYSYMDEDNIKTYMLYLTKNETLYKEEISELLDEDVKIIYNNNKVKGKEVFDYDTIEINKIRNKLKLIDYTDITFGCVKEGSFGVLFYYPIFNDKELNSEIDKYKIISHSLFYDEGKKKLPYFGHLKNRFHCSGINKVLRGIGLGYKLYKAFIKYQGYIISDENTTIDARNVYYKLLHDDDIYHIIDSKNNKVMLIWKDNPKLEQILRIVREYESTNNLNFDYDKK